jgi:Tol biopolymer transport system component
VREGTKAAIGTLLVLAGVAGAVTVHEVTDSCDEWGRFLYEDDVGERVTRLALLEGGEHRFIGDERRVHAADLNPQGDAVVVAAGRGGTFDSEFETFIRDKTILYKMDLDGGDVEILTQNVYAPRWSPDGRHVLFIRESGQGRGLWVIDLFTREERQLFATPPSGGPDPNHTTDAAWSPDSKRIAFVVSYSSGRTETQRLYTIAIDGSDRRQILETDAGIGDLAWSPDGETLMWSGPFRGGAGVGTESINVASLSDPIPKSIEPHSSTPMFSADGNRIAYVIGWEGHYPARLVVGPLDGSNPQRVPGTPEEDSGGVSVQDWVTSC